jgi:hypothetical protein
MKTFNTILFIFLISCISVIQVNAQIIYTDVIPDDTLSWPASVPWTVTYDLDINNDSFSDFTISDIYTGNGQCGIGGPPKRIATARILSNDPNFLYGCNYIYPTALNFGDTINYNFDWQTTSGTLFNIRGGICIPIDTTGYWRSLSDHYLPIRFSKNGNNYFGWLRMNLYQQNSPVLVSPIRIIIKEYAYNSTPNQIIIAGSRISIGINGNSLICNGDSTTCVATGGTSYLWSTGETAASITVSPVSNTIYSVMVCDSAIGDTVLLSQLITVDTNFTASIVQTSLTLNADPADAISYQWLDCSTMLPMPGAVNLNLNPSGNGSYAVIINNGCIDTSSCFTFSSVGINENENQLLFNISPNPSSELSTIILKLTKREMISLNIFDLNGKRIEILADNFFEAGEHKIELNTNKLNAGIYFLKLKAGEFLKTEKLIIAKTN